MKDQNVFPQFDSPCPTKEEIFRGYLEKEQIKNFTPYNGKLTQSNVHWIPPPAKTSQAFKEKSSKKNLDSCCRRSLCWSKSDDKINEKHDKNSRNWTKFVDDIDRSIDDLSHNVQELLQKNTKHDMEKITYVHTPIKDYSTFAGGAGVFHHSPIKDVTSNLEIHRLSRELQKTRDQLYHAETRLASLEALKSHLQLQLRQRSAQNDRIVAQMRNSESKTRQTVIQLTQQLSDSDVRIQELSKQRDLLKHAARRQKKRALKAEEEISRLKDNKRGEKDEVKAMDNTEETTLDKIAEMELTIRDLRERLAQSSASNRSLQAYLTFLKRSYSSIFDEGEKKERTAAAAVSRTATPEIRTSNSGPAANV